MVRSSTANHVIWIASLAALILLYAVLYFSAINVVSPVLVPSVGDPTLASRVLKKDLMFIKTHKCGTSTIVNAIYLYGVRRKLNFVIQNADYEPHKLRLRKLATRPLEIPRPGQNYNLQCQHGYFIPEIEHQILPKERTRYVTIVRSPISHFKSSFTFFNAEANYRKKYNGTRNKKDLSLEELYNSYLDDREIVNTSMSMIELPKLGVDLVLNSVARDLGWVSFSSEANGTLQERIDAFIEHIDSEMDLVLITDRMEESMVMLKEMMGWQMNDVLYLNRMVQNHRHTAPLSDKTKEKILAYQYIDRQIFAHFNATFEERILKIGRQKFDGLVNELKQLQLEFEDKCFDKTVKVSTGFGTSSWNISEYGRTEDRACEFLQTRDARLTAAVRQLQRSQDYQLDIGEEFVLRDLMEWVQKHYQSREQL